MPSPRSQSCRTSTRKGPRRSSSCRRLEQTWLTGTGFNLKAVATIPKGEKPSTRRRQTDDYRKTVIRDRRQSQVLVTAALLIGPAVLATVFLVYVGALRTRHHRTSMLTCARCGRTFEYDWVPLASFSAFRLGSRRHLQCPLCKEWSTFDIKSTRVRPGGASPIRGTEAPSSGS